MKLQFHRINGGREFFVKIPLTPFKKGVLEIKRIVCNNPFPFITGKWKPF